MMPRMRFKLDAFVGAYRGHHSKEATDWVFRQTNIQLRDCPFCDCSRHVLDREERRVICAACGAEGPGAKRPGDLMTMAHGWNGTALEEVPELKSHIHSSEPSDE